jgi:DNA-binding GntR family transcriptional regulator
MSQTINAPTTAINLASVLRDAVNMGILAPGAPLRQEVIAAKYGVSRIPVREAFGRLESEGLLTVHPNRGAYVNSPSIAEVQEIFDLRLLLEPDILRRATPLHTPKTIRHLEAIQRELEVEDDALAWLKLDQAFHRALYEPSARIRTLSLVDSLRVSVNRYYVRLFTPDSNRGNWNREHNEIVSILGRGDGVASAAALELHLRLTAALTIRFLQKGNLGALLD